MTSRRFKFVFWGMFVAISGDDLLRLYNLHDL